MNHHSSQRFHAAVMLRSSNSESGISRFAEDWITMLTPPSASVLLGSPQPYVGGRPQHFSVSAFQRFSSINLACAGESVCSRDRIAIDSGRV
jgi:hypothetical protein